MQSQSRSRLAPSPAEERFPGDGTVWLLWKQRGSGSREQEAFLGFATGLNLGRC